MNAGSISMVEQRGGEGGISFHPWKGKKGKNAYLRAFVIGGGERGKTILVLKGVRRQGVAGQ